MNRLFFILAFILSGVVAQAQSQDQKEEIQSLVQRIDSLEHELSYLQLTYALSTLNSDVTMFANEIDIKSVAIQLDISNRDFDRELGEAYKEYLDVCLKKQESYNRLIDAKKELFVAMVYKCNFSESELNVLKGYYDHITYTYGKLESSMKFLELTIKVYRQNLQ